MPRFLIFVLVTSSPVLFSTVFAAETLDVKAGLWEVKWTLQPTGIPGIPPEKLAEMSPEQRAKLESTFKALATGKTDVDRSCLTAEDRTRLFVREDSPECKTTMLTQSARALHFKTECLDTRGARTSEFRVDSPNPEVAAGTMDAVSKGAGGRETRIHMKLDARWLKTDCEDQASD